MCIQWLSTFICCGWAYGCTLTLLSVQMGAKFWEIGVRWMTLWCHGSGCKPPLTASHIHIGCIESDWATSNAVDGHMGAHHYTGIPLQVGAEFWEIGVRWSPNDIVVCVMVEAVSHHWLHPTSILNVYKEIEHLLMLQIGIWVHPYGTQKSFKKKLNF